MTTHCSLTLQKTQVKPRKKWEEWERGERGEEGGRERITEKGCHILVVCSDSGHWQKSGKVLAGVKGGENIWSKYTERRKAPDRSENSQAAQRQALLWEMTFVKQDFQHLSMVFRSQSPSVGCNNSHWLRTSLNWQPTTAAWVISGRLQSSPW